MLSTGTEPATATFPGPVTPVVRDTARFSRARHSHPAAQLIYAISGVASVTTDAGTWVVPPNRAVWVPAGVEHATRSYGPIKFRAIFVAPGSDAQLPLQCRVVEVSPLLRELIRRLAELPNDRKSRKFAERIAYLLLDELSFLPTQPVNLPTPNDARLACLCAEFQANPDHDLSIEIAASRIGVSRSTLMRLFRQETGMSFGRWCQQARMLNALGLLAEGRSVLNVALDCGYQSPSAFAAVFRRTLGKTPREYFR